MIGARHSAGSTISNGSRSSPLNWVIVGRRPWHPFDPDRLILSEKRSFYEDIFSVIITSLPGKKIRKPPGTCPQRENAPLHCVTARPGPEIAPQAVRPWLEPFHP